MMGKRAFAPEVTARMTFDQVFIICDEYDGATIVKVETDAEAKALLKR